MKRSLLLVCLFLVSQIWAYDDEGIVLIKNGPVHEAFLVQEFGEIVLDAYPIKPPQDISEFSSRQTDMKAIWIPGYWAWTKQQEEFVWVSGVWRRPPPGHQWIQGYWKHYSEGWVWIPGFWSAIPEKEFLYIDQPPPDPIDEKIPPHPTSSSNSFFWVPGFWNYDDSTQEFVWYSGRWEAFNENWVYVPAHYIWREHGYLFIPGFWDWTLEDRGTAYACAYIKPSKRLEIRYEPSLVLEPLFILELYYPYWPNYLCLYHFHYFHHQKLWMKWGGGCPWWGWDGWWSFPWQDIWSLWWWWCHPGYPNPFWLDAELAHMIAPPPGFIVKMMKNVVPPPNVTPNGVVGNLELIEASEKITGKDYPIMPRHPKQLGMIQQAAHPKTPEKPFLKPEGTGKEKNIEKPFFGPSRNQLRREPQRVKVPSYPSVSEPPTRKIESPIRKVEPPIQKVEPSIQKVEPSIRKVEPSIQKPSPTPSESRPRQIPEPTYRPAPQSTVPQYQTIYPKSPQSDPQYPKSSRPYPESPRRPDFPQRFQPELRQPSENVRPEYPSEQVYPSYPSEEYRNEQVYPVFPREIQPPAESPSYHGYQNPYEYPQVPMHIEPQDRIMTYPQPQRNPPSPPIYNEEKPYQPELSRVRSFYKFLLTKADHQNRRVLQEGSPEPQVYYEEREYQHGLINFQSIYQFLLTRKNHQTHTALQQGAPTSYYEETLPNRCRQKGRRSLLKLIFLRD